MPSFSRPCSRRRLPGGLAPLLVLIGLILALDSFPSAASSGSVRDDRWRQDLRFLAETLPKVHKNAFFRIKPEEFQSAVARLDAAIPKLRDHEIIVEMAAVVAMIGDAHTALSVFQPAAGFHFYPIRLTWFKDGLFVTSIAQEYRQALGARVVKIGAADADAAAAAVSRIISHENEALIKSSAPGCLVTAEVLHALGLSPDIASACFKVAAGNAPVEMRIPAVVPGASVQWAVSPDPAMVPAPLYLSNQRAFYWYKYLPEYQAVYFQYNHCQNMPGRKFSAFARDLLRFVDRNHIKKFLIDLRLNGGGNSLILEPLINGLRRRPAINRPGSLFVLIGGKTFSSAILNALSLRNTTRAILAGEPTGGRPNHYGEVKTFKLPNSGLIVSYSTKYFRYAKEDMPSLMPDLMVETASADYFAGRDPVLDAVLDYK